LEKYLKMVGAAPSASSKVSEEDKPSQGSSMTNYFSYGKSSDVGNLLGEPDSAEAEKKNPWQFAAGGFASRMTPPLMAAGGKLRQDFRRGAAVSGPGDGQSDDIPAMLADGEFVFPADVVAALGNGSTKAGSEKLYKMMHEIRAYHRSAKPKDLPPAAKKSPLEYLKKTRR
jgi:hypothetical protein